MTQSQMSKRREKPAKPRPDFPLSPTPRRGGRRRSRGSCITSGHGPILTPRWLDTSKSAMTCTLDGNLAVRAKG